MTLASFSALLQLGVALLAIVGNFGGPGFSSTPDFSASLLFCPSSPQQLPRCGPEKGYAVKLRPLAFQLFPRCGPEQGYAVKLRPSALGVFDTAIMPVFLLLLLLQRVPRSLSRAPWGASLLTVRMANFFHFQLPLPRTLLSLGRPRIADSGTGADEQRPCKRQSQ